MLVLNFIFDLLWTDTGSFESFVSFLGFRELEWIEKYVAKLLCGFSQYRPEIASILAYDIKPYTASFPILFSALFSKHSIIPYHRARQISTEVFTA